MNGAGEEDDDDDGGRGEDDDEEEEDGTAAMYAELVFFLSRTPKQLASRCPLLLHLSQT